MAEPYPPGLADQRGPSSPRSLKVSSPPTIPKAVDMSAKSYGDVPIATAPMNVEAAQLLLSVSAPVTDSMVEKAILSAEASSPLTKPITIPSASYLHTPPEEAVEMIDTSRSVSNGTVIDSASQAVLNPHSTVHSTVAPSVADQAMSPAQSTAGSTVATKPRNKRKRNAVAGPSRPTVSPVVNGDKPDHYMGEDNSIIRCICDSTDDDGFTIQCELCGAWEHGYCFGYFDEASAPDKFFCELCDPRPVDREKARRLQGMDEDEDVHRDPYDPVKVRSKGKKPRADPGQKDEGKDSTTGKPPGAKTKRRPAVQKPKPPKPAAVDPPPAPVFKEPDLPVVGPAGIPGQELDDPYFRVEPWKLEYTPVKANVVRGKAARQAMRKLWLDWADDDLEDLPRRSRHTENDGFPSPTNTGATRFSPEAALFPPDYSILAPPVPPVPLVGVDLAALGIPVTVKPIRDGPSFLPISYNEISTSTGVYRSPTLYGVFTKEKVHAGSFIGEIRGEIVDCATYRRDPINQYAGLGIPKPFVRAMGPPIDLIIDSRGFGTELRFVRSSCHPNAVVRPIVWRPSESDGPRLRFGIFASVDIPRRQEITLAWEWDDHHIVHALQSIIHTGISDDGSITPPDALVPGQTVRTMAQKFDAVLTTLYGTFSSCACTIPGNCAIAQMKFIIDFSATLEDRRHSVNGTRSAKGDLGELVGAVRGWRRREVEVENAKRGNKARRSSTTVTALRTSMSQEAESAESNGIAEVVEGIDDSVRIEVDRDEEQDEEDEEPEGVTPAAQLGDEEGEIALETEMDIDRPIPPPILPTIPETLPIETATTPIPETSPHPRSPVLAVAPVPDIFGTSASTRPSATSPPSRRADLQTPGEVAKPELSASVSSVESAEIDTGYGSDATTATAPRSAFSESGTDTEDELSPPPKLPIHKELASMANRSESDEPVRIVPGLFTDRSPPPTTSYAGVSGSPISGDDQEENEIVAERPENELSSPPRRATPTPVLTSRGPKRVRGRGRPIVNGNGIRKHRKFPAAGQPKGSASPEKRASALNPAVGPMAEPSEIMADQEQEPIKRRSPTPPPREPTPPPRDPTPPPRRVPMAEYLKLAKRKKEGVVPPIESPAGEAPLAQLTSEPPSGPLTVATPPMLAKPELVDDAGIPGTKHMSPVKQPEPLTSAPINGEINLDGSMLPATVKTETDPNRFKFTDYLPSHGSTQTPAVETPSTTPGLGLTRGDYFPYQPASHVQAGVSSSYVPRKSSSYVPRHQGSMTQGSASESPSIDDYLPKSSAQSLPPSFAPRPSPASEPLPLAPATSQSSSSYQPRVSPYRPPLALPEIPPPAIREAPPHAPAPIRAPPTGPKVPPKGPRTSGGSAGSPFVPPRERDNWDARDRERERDRDRDWDRERDRDRDREPVSPRATFGVGSARGGAPKPVPFHRGRGVGRGGMIYRGGRGRGM